MFNLTAYYYLSANEEHEYTDGSHDGEDDDGLNQVGGLHPELFLRNKVVDGLNHPGQAQTDEHVHTVTACNTSKVITRWTESPRAGPDRRTRSHCYCLQHK